MKALGLLVLLCLSALGCEGTQRRCQIHPHKWEETTVFKDLDEPGYWSRQKDVTR